jgi:DNA-directed RNA polymerase specialized sigma24 family protein
MKDEADSERLGQLEKAFARLHSEHREIILLARVEMLTYPEMGIRLGLNVEQVEHRLALAIAALDRAIERLERPWWRFW